jgi:hypothetical protein
MEPRQWNFRKALTEMRPGEPRWCTPPSCLVAVPIIALEESGAVKTCAHINDETRCRLMFRGSWQTRSPTTRTHQNRIRWSNDLFWRLERLYARLRRRASSFSSDAILSLVLLNLISSISVDEALGFLRHDTFPDGCDFLLSITDR